MQLWLNDGTQTKEGIPWFILWRLFSQRGYIFAKDWLNVSNFRSILTLLLPALTIAFTLKTMMDLSQNIQEFLNMFQWLPVLWKMERLKHNHVCSYSTSCISSTVSLFCSLFLRIRHIFLRKPLKEFKWFGKIWILQN